MSFTSPTLPKGQACLDCRRRKIKCDGARPICGPCYRSQRYEDCEYGNGKTPSKMQTIEDSISQVESRIMHLEMESSVPSFPLQSPYTEKVGHRQPRRVSLPGPQTHDASDNTNSNAAADGVSAQLLRIALDTIAPHAHEVGFFLSQKRFRDACFGVNSSYERPPSPLLNGICLWAACLSASEPLGPLENSFLSRAVKLSTSILSSSHRLKLIYGIQTEVLLSQYFLNKGRLVEAQYHLSLAVSHVVLGDLASIRSARGSRVAAAGRPPISYPQDYIEEGEHIIGFWTVLSLDKMWSSALNFASHFGSDALNNIDTPWPAEMGEYERNQLPQQSVTVNTVQKFIEDPDTDRDGTSYLATLSKCALLLSRASTISQQWRPNMSQAEAAAFFKTFTQLNSRISKFRANLPPLNSLAGCASTIKARMVLAHSVAHAATIQLNRTFIDVNPECRELCLVACKSIVSIIRMGSLRNLTQINPIMGSIWSATSHILLQEIMRLRAVPKVERAVADMTAGYEEIVTIVAHFSRNCPFMQFQLSQIRSLNMT